ncbi:MAG: hypothetical protein CMK07_07490 [Ponticaulis sp.]|nr:hypothetical protein [Ponticaulis sp.]
MFSPSTFDVTLGIDDTIVFDQNGTISNPYNRYNGAPENYGYTPEYTLGYLHWMLDGVGYDVDYVDMLAKYGASTFHAGINSAVVVGGVVTNYMDNGIAGTTGSDVIYDGSGDNIIDADAGDDFVLVGSGNDAVAGGSGNDEIYTAGGNDIVDGGSGDDQIFLWDGDDQAAGGRDNDEIFGEAGNDRLWGQQGHDYLEGGLGNDILRGGGGRDELVGGEGDDTLIGNGGHDTLAGNEGMDTLTGGGGRDTFVFSLGDDNDTITDFDSSKDTIDLDSDLFNVSNPNTLGLSDVQNIASQVGNDVVIDFGNGDTLTLEDFQLNTLDSNDFSFF